MPARYSLARQPESQRTSEVLQSDRQEVSSTGPVRLEEEPLSRAAKVCLVALVLTLVVTVVATAVLYVGLRNGWW
jgi:hypothetical protein